MILMEQSSHCWKVDSAAQTTEQFEQSKNQTPVLISAHIHSTPAAAPLFPPLIRSTQVTSKYKSVPPSYQRCKTPLHCSLFQLSQGDPADREQGNNLTEKQKTWSPGKPATQQIHLPLDLWEKPDSSTKDQEEYGHEPSWVRQQCWPLHCTAGLRTTKTGSNADFDSCWCFHVQ